MAVTCQSCDYRYSIFEKLPGNYCDNTQALSVKSEAVHIYVYVLSLNLTYQREVGVIRVTVTPF